MSTSIEHLPAPRERRLAVRVTPDALRQIRGGSPWLYDGSITSVSHETCGEPTDGEVAQGNAAGHKAAFAIDLTINYGLEA